MTWMCRLLNVVSTLCLLAVGAIYILRNAALLDISEEWFWLLFFIAAVTWAAFLFLRPPKKISVPEMMRRLDGAYIEGEDAKVFDYWRAAAWLFISVMIALAFFIASPHS